MVYLTGQKLELLRRGSSGYLRLNRITSLGSTKQTAESLVIDGYLERGRRVWPPHRIIYEWYTLTTEGRQHLERFR